MTKRRTATRSDPLKLDQPTTAQAGHQRLDLPDHAAASPAPQPTDDLIENVLALVASGRSLRKSCEAHGIPPSSFSRWVRADEPSGVAEQYARAREQQAHALADGVIEMAMDPDAKADPNLLRVRLDAAKWAAARILPKVYGDRVDVNANVSGNVSVGWVIDLTGGQPVLDGTAVRVDQPAIGGSDPLHVGADGSPTEASNQ